MQVPLTFLPGDIALPYGLDATGKLVPVSAVRRGLECRCTCPGCGKPLVAKQGIVIRHHFAHIADAECSTGFESMVHLLAKDLISREKQILVPSLSVSSGRTRKFVSEAKKLRLTNVRLEVWDAGIRPDIVADYEGHDLIIEIAVTHKAEPAKIEKLMRRGAPAIEIDLSEFHKREVNEASLWLAILDAAPRYWLFNRLGAIAQYEVEKEEHDRLRLERLEAEARAAAMTRLAEEWVRWEDAQVGVRREAERARRDQIAANTFLLGRSKTMLRTAALHTMDAESADAWVAEQEQIFVSRGYLEKTDLDIAGFNQECGSRLALIVAHEQNIRAAHANTRDAVLRAAITRFGATDLADLWLRTTNPKLGRRRPYDVCLELGGVEKCKAALA